MWVQEIIFWGRCEEVTLDSGASDKRDWRGDSIKHRRDKQRNIETLNPGNPEINPKQTPKVHTMWQM